MEIILAGHVALQYKGLFKGMQTTSFTYLYQRQNIKQLLRLCVLEWEIV